MSNRWLLSPRLFLFASLLFILTLAVACGTSAPEPAAPEPAAPAEPAAAAPAAAPAAETMAQSEPAAAPAAAAPAPTAVPVPAMETMAEPTVVRYVESQGEIQVETNQHCGGNRPIISQFLPYTEFLVEADPVTAEIIPWLAESWETTADARSWTFHLEPGVQFHHGYGELTAKDFEAMALAKGDESCASSTTSFWKEMDRAEIVDDHTIIFHMNNPSLPMLSVASNLPTGLELISFSKDQLDEVGYENFDDVKPASTSYYQFKERKLGESVVYERVPYEHWRYQSPFEEMEIRWIGEETTRLAGLLAGEIHAIALSRDLQPSAIDSGMKVIPAQQAFSQLSLFFGGMYFMPGDPDFDPTTPWADIRVRKAMNKAINRDELNDFIFRGEGERMHVTACCHQVLDPEIYNPEWETRWDEAYGYDPEEAKRLLAEAGYNEENPVQVEMLNYRTSGEPESPLAVEALPQYWGPVGIDVTITDLDSGAYSAMRRAKQIQHMMYANVFSFRKIQDRIRTNAPSNTTGHTFDHPFMEEKYQETLTVFTQPEVDAIGREVANFWYDQYWTIPIFWFRFNFTVNPEVLEDWVYLNRGYYWHNQVPATK